jgi:membrane-bound serine protease (ClpP class)
MNRALFMAMLGVLFAGVALRADTTPATMPDTTVVPAPGSKTVIVQLNGEINDFTRDQFFKHFQQARDLGAKAIIVDLDTYGGLVTSGTEISRFLKRQDDVHTIMFVKDKAISAGAMIAMAGDEIVMSRSATLGDCAPIVFQFDGTLDSLPAAERAKQESPILADFLESAQRNHHDPLLAAAMVAVQISVYWVQSPTGERKFVDKPDYAKLTVAGWKDVPGAPVPVDSDQTLLTVDSTHAVQYGLATGEAESAEALAQQRNLSVAADLKTGPGDELVDWLGSTIARTLLIIIFLSALNVVIHAPGHGVAEVVGLAALLLMLGVPLLTGYAQWWEILTIFIGLSLVAVEILLPGHFVPGITGAGLALVGLVMTFVPMQPGGVPGFLPTLNQTWVGLEHGLGVVAGALACSAFLWFWMNRYLPQVPYFKRIILTNVSGGGTVPVVGAGLAVWPAVGSVGTSVSELKPGGSAEFFDQAIADRRVTSVVSESGFIPPGSKVVVREVAGNRVVVQASHA